jgi:hypothetical protein
MERNTGVDLKQTGWGGVQWIDLAYVSEMSIGFHKIQGNS